MPEGDTILLLSRRLHRTLAGQRVRAAISPRVHGLERVRQRHIVGVWSVGKHAIIELEGELGLRVHLGMDGRWRVRPRSGRPANLPPRLTVALSTERHVAICSRAKEVELASLGELWATSGSLGRLGPDLLADELDLDEVARHALSAVPLEGSTLGQVLLDQRRACGIGNIYKDETLFLERRSPFATAEELDVPCLARLYGRARSLMQANLRPGDRITTSGRVARRSSFWVHGRTGHGCFRCGGPIAEAPLGQPPRRTWWCPRCQPG